MVPDNVILKIGRTNQGHVVRLEGRGTFLESPTLLSLISQMLAADPDDLLVIDLSATDYADSTFLGCMVALHRRFNSNSKVRVYLGAISAGCRAALNATHLDSFFPMVETIPPVQGDWAVLDKLELAAGDLGRHILETHRLLIEADASNQEIFGPVVAQLTRELDERSQQ